jgi:hypothetical protein
LRGIIIGSAKSGFRVAELLDNIVQVLSDGTEGKKGESRKVKAQG